MAAEAWVWEAWEAQRLQSGVPGLCLPGHRVPSRTLEAEDTLAIGGFPLEHQLDAGCGRPRPVTVCPLLPGQGGRDGRGWDGGGQQLTPAFREGCPSGGSQPRLAHLLTPRCPLPASRGRRFSDRGISISVKSPQTMPPPVRGDEKSGAGWRGAFEVPERWGRGDPRGRLRGDEGR